MSKKNLLFCGLVFFLLFSQLNSNTSQAEEYLNTVIDKINKMEKDLQKLQQESTYNENTQPLGSPNNTIASHEQRLIDLEEEIRTLNGRIDEVFFELKNISNELKDLKAKDNMANNIPLNNIEDESLVTVEKEKKPETITSEDPNMQNNPSMKVLGVIKDSQTDNQNTESLNLNNSENNIEKPNNIITKKEDSITNQELADLSKNPSDIYKHAYNMLIQENFLEAEKYFNIFLGENPNDPLASNAYYWLGETFYVQKQFQKAAISFAKGYQKFPKGNKALDQLFKLALTFINLGKNEDACASFSKLDLEFPNASKRIKNRAKEYKIRAKC